MAEEKKQVKFKVGDRVDGGYGLKGIVTRLGQDGDFVFVRWDGNNFEELTAVSGLTKLIHVERAKRRLSMNRENIFIIALLVALALVIAGLVWAGQTG